MNDNIKVGICGCKHRCAPPTTYKTIILKPNCVCGHNTLTQEMLSEKNTKYVIKYDFTLGGERVIVPEECILEFDGGSLRNGTIVGQNTVFINVGDVDIWGENLTRQGTWREKQGCGIPDKEYDPEHNSGLGRKTLKLKGDSNILTQDDFDQENTVYVITYDFDLNGETIEIPKGCILEFDGGSIRNGILVLDNTYIISDYPSFDCRLEGSCSNTELYVKWLINQDQYHIQDLLDLTGKGSVLSFEKKTYVLEKNEELPSSFVPNAALGEYGDQPCLMVRKDGIKIEGNNATLKVNTHAQGILEVFGANDAVIENLKLEGYGEQVPLDGNTGRAEKGSSGDKYYTTGFWNYHKNNSYDTSKLHIYRTIEDPKPGNPEFGTFGNGFIGNIGIGILIYRGSSNVTVRNVETFNFNYAGIHLGFLGDAFHYAESDIKLISNNIIIKDCVMHDCYNVGLGMSDCYDVSVSQCSIYNIGHPNATKEDTYHDPGYGISAICSYRSDVYNITIDGNSVKNCARKGIDFHSGRDSIISNNKIVNCIIGAIYAVSTANDHICRNIVISNNYMEYCSQAVYAVEGACMLGHSYSVTDESFQNILFDGNVIKDCGCYIPNYEGIININFGHGIRVSNNMICNSDSAAKGVNARFPISVGGTKAQDEIRKPSDIYIENNILYSDVNVLAIVACRTASLDIVGNTLICTNDETIIDPISGDDNGGGIFVYCYAYPEETVVNVINNRAKLKKANNNLAYSFAGTQGISYGNETNIGVAYPKEALAPKKDTLFETISVAANGTAEIPISPNGEMMLIKLDASGETVIAVTNWGVEGVTLLGTTVYFATDSSAATGKVLLSKSSNSSVINITNNLASNLVIKYKNIFGFNG